MAPRRARHAVVLFNRGEDARDMHLDWSELGLPSTTQASVRDVVERQTLPDGVGPSMHYTVAKHAAMFLLLTPKP